MVSINRRPSRSTPRVFTPSQVRTTARVTAPAVQLPEVRRPVAPPRVAPTAPVTNPSDWHLPTLDEVFVLARKYPGKLIFLDTKLPANDPEVARRMARQYAELLTRFPDMKDRVVIGVPNAATLQVIKDELAKTPGLEHFHNFTLDHEELNTWHPGEAFPLNGSGDNRFVSIGDPKTPLSGGDFEQLVTMARDTLARTKDPHSPDYGKQLIVWTINDPEKMKQLAKLGVDGIMTDDPVALNQVLDALYAKDDPKRPRVWCHRGGPDDGFAPENTLPMIERGLRSGDAIEIDVCSAKDGAILFHDDEPAGLLGTLRNLDLEGGAFRPTNPGLFDRLRGKPLHELTIAEIRSGYGFARSRTEAPFAHSKSGLLRGFGKVLHAVSQGARYVRGALLTGLLYGWRGIKAVGELVGSGVKAVGKAVGSVLKSVGSFFSGLFGKKKKAVPPRAATPAPARARALSGVAPPRQQRVAPRHESSFEIPRLRTPTPARWG